MANAQPVRCEGHEEVVGAVALSPDGKHVISIGDKLFARVWNANDGQMVRKIQVFPPNTSYGYISDVAFSPDGKRIATAAWQQPVRFWNPFSGEQAGEPLAVKQAAHGLAFSPNGSLLAVAEFAEVKIWDLRSRTLLQDFRLDERSIGQAWRVAFSQDGNLLAAALLDYGGTFVPKATKVRVWDVGTGKELLAAWPNESAVAVAFSPDGKWLAAAGSAVEIWDVNSQRSLHRIDAVSDVLCLAFSPDGKIIATGGNSSDITLWNAATGAKAGALKAHAGQVRDLSFSKDGKKLASAGEDKSVLIWSMTEVRPEH
jgi:WD40 repeat protein